MLVVLVLSAATTRAGAAPPPQTAPAGRPPPLFQLRPLPHAAATAGIFLTVGLAQRAVAPGLAPQRGCRLQQPDGACLAADLPALDRWSLGWQSAPWRVASDLLQAAAVALPVGAALVEHGRAAGGGRWDEAARDVLVGLESVAVADLLTTVLKFAVRRPRPGSFYGPATSASGELSFPSGHVATVAAASGAWATTFFLRHPDSRWRPWVAGGAAAATAATALGRVLGGMHFTTDVLAAAALGAGTGLLVPSLARAPLQVRPWAAPAAGPDGGQVHGVEVSWPGF